MFPKHYDNTNLTVQLYFFHMFILEKSVVGMQEYTGGVKKQDVDNRLLTRQYYVGGIPVCAYGN